MVRRENRKVEPVCVEGKALLRFHVFVPSKTASHKQAPETGLRESSFVNFRVASFKVAFLVLVEVLAMQYHDLDGYEWY